MTTKFPTVTFARFSRMLSWKVPRHEGILGTFPLFSHESPTPSKAQVIIFSADSAFHWHAYPQDATYAMAVFFIDLDLTSTENRSRPQTFSGQTSSVPRGPPYIPDVWRIFPDNEGERARIFCEQSIGLNKFVLVFVFFSLLTSTVGKGNFWDRGPGREKMMSQNWAKFRANFFADIHRIHSIFGRFVLVCFVGPKTYGKPTANVVAFRGGRRRLLRNVQMIGTGLWEDCKIFKPFHLWQKGHCRNITH